MKNRDVLFVVTSHDNLGDTGKPAGFFLSAASHPYKMIIDAGFEADFVSPRGGRVPAEGVDLDDPVNEWFLQNDVARKKISNTLKPEEICPRNYYAIYFVGGHGAIWDFKDNKQLQTITRAIWENGGIVASVCHGTIGLLNVQLSYGRYLVDGKRMTAFSNAEEKANGTDTVVPYFVADELQKRGAQLEHADEWKKKVIRDGRLITGQNPASAMGVGEALVNALKKFLYVVELR